MAEFESATNVREISRDRLAELLNEDLSRDYQAIIAEGEDEEAVSAHLPGPAPPRGPHAGSN